MHNGRVALRVRTGGSTEARIFINGIRYSQNELDNGNLTAIQLVNYLRISYLQKNFHTLNTKKACCNFATRL